MIDTDEKELTMPYEKEAALE
jgi:hypothetical protein